MTYIVFEGIDRAGKTTAFRKIIEKIESMHHECSVYGMKEPINRAPFANINPENWMEMAYEMTRQRMAVPELIKAYDVVLSDRSFLSTYAYQGVNPEARTYIKLINAFMPKPDMVYLFDLDPTSAMQRKENEYDELSHLEEINFLNDVRQRFRDATIEYHPIPFHIIDAMKPSREIVELIWEDIISHNFIY